MPVPAAAADDGEGGVADGQPEADQRHQDGQRDGHLGRPEHGDRAHARRRGSGCRSRP